MNIEEDPRIRVARRGLVLSWTYFTLFIAVALGAAATFRNEPFLFGLPRWVAMSCLLVPAIFVVLLIPIIEMFLPDISLSDQDEEEP